MEKSILLIDDSWFMRMISQNCLKDGGFHVFYEAENGKEGVALFQEKHPDLVLLDINMPVLSGVETLQQIMEIDPNAKVIICSAMGQEPLIRKTILMGAKSFVVKPYREDYFLETVHKVLNEEE